MITLESILIILILGFSLGLFISFAATYERQKKNVEEMGNRAPKNAEGKNIISLILKFVALFLLIMVLLSFGNLRGKNKLLGKALFYNEIEAGQYLLKSYYFDKENLCAVVVIDSCEKFVKLDKKSLDIIQKNANILSVKIKTVHGLNLKNGKIDVKAFSLVKGRLKDKR